jgi:hypothetical protein
VTTAYPGGLDAFTNPSGVSNLNDAPVLHSAAHANLNDAVEAIEAELGLLPKGGSATVKARLDAVDTALTARALASRTISAGTGLTGGGDLSTNRTLTVDLEYLQDQVAAMLVAGTNVTLSYDDALGKLTVNASGGGGGGANMGAHLSGRYHFNACAGGTFNGAFVPTVGTLYAIPFWVGATATYDRIATNIGTAGSAGAVTRLGIYNVAASGLPGTLVLDAGTVDSTTIGDKNITISQSLSPGVYFTVMLTNDAAVRWRAIGSAPVPNPMAWFGNAGPVEHTERYLTFTGYTATSALPSTATTAGMNVPTAGDIPVISLRAA